MKVKTMNDTWEVRKWRFIQDYETSPEDLANSKLANITSIWLDKRDKLLQIPSVQVSIAQLKRRWAIETGLIERLYVFKQQAVENMVERGIEVYFESRAEDSEYSGYTRNLILDQHAALNNILLFIGDDRELSTSYIKELHYLFSHNQKTVDGIDQFGSRTKATFVPGVYKTLPNNPVTPDGTLHEYCPPEHVASEMDKLIALHRAHLNVTPEVEAAWLHHRCVQIHPFQDGNGRTARALASLVFVQAKFLPILVTNHDREEYIQALDDANDGDLRTLVSFFAQLQLAQIHHLFRIAET